MFFQGKLSVVIPAYNEEKLIQWALQETCQSIAAFMEDFEVLVVDDGSTDATRALCRAAAEENQHIRMVGLVEHAGKGRALCAGTALAQGNYVAFCDADLELHPSQLENFMERLLRHDADAVIGCKLHPESSVDYPFHRRVLSLGYYALLRLLFNLDTQDTQSGLKLFRAAPIKQVMKAVLVKRYAFDIELLSLLQENGGKIISAPIMLQFNRVSSRIRLKDILDMFLDTLRVFYRLRILHYYQRHPDNQEILTVVESAEIFPNTTEYK